MNIVSAVLSNGQTSSARKNSLENSKNGQLDKCRCNDVVTSASHVNHDHTVCLTFNWDLHVNDQLFLLTDENWFFRLETEQKI